MNAVLSLLAVAVIGFEAPPSSGGSGEAFPPFQLAVDVGRSGAVPFEETAETLPPPPKVWEGGADWPLSLAEAIRIGVENSEAVRVRPRPGELPAQTSGRDDLHGQAIAISLAADRPAPALSPWRFRSEVMAHLRSVERQYWTLAQAHAGLQASERAIELVEEILRRQEAGLEFRQSSPEDVAAVRRRLETIRLARAARFSEVTAAERRLRTVLGLPTADDRRIVPASRPTGTDAGPRWDDCLTAMLANQPDVLRQRANTRTAALRRFGNDPGLMRLRDVLLLPDVEAPSPTWFAASRLLVIGMKLAPARPRMVVEGLRTLAARGATRLVSALDPSTDPPAVTARQRLVNNRRAAYAYLKQYGYLQQVARRAKQTLERSHRVVEDRVARAQAASTASAEADLRLESQRALFEGARLTIDGYLDAVCESTDALAAVEQSRAESQVARVELEEAQGTLLAFDNITIVDHPFPDHPAPRDTTTRLAEGTLPPSRTARSIDADVMKTSGEAAPLPAPAHTALGGPERGLLSPPASFPDLIPGPLSTPTTLTFDVLIGESRPIRVRGSLSITRGASPPSSPRP